MSEPGECKKAIALHSPRRMLLHILQREKCALHVVSFCGFMLHIAQCAMHMARCVVLHIARSDIITQSLAIIT